MRGFLLPLLEEAAVVVLVLFLLIFGSPLRSQHESKQNKFLRATQDHKSQESKEKTFALDGPVEERER